MVNMVDVVRDRDLDYPLIRTGGGAAYNVETFNMWLHDPRERIGLNVQFVANNSDFSHFNCEVLLFEGDQIHVGVFRGEARPDGPGSTNVFATNLEPFKRWRYEFVGMLGRTSAADSRATNLEDMPKVLASFDLEAKMVAAPIEQGSQGDDGVQASSGTKPRRAFRYEQLTRFRGRLRIGERTVALDGLGFRNHRRNSASIFNSGAIGHSWMTGLFPSGQGFHLCFYRHSVTSQAGWLYALYFDGQRHHDAEALEFPHYSGLAAPEPYRIRLRAAGRTLDIQGLGATPYMKGPGSAKVERDQESRPILFSRAPGRFVLDGEEGGGVIERSLHRDFAPGGVYEAAPQEAVS